jgi:serine/threonine-protein kinase RsbW
MSDEAENRCEFDPERLLVKLDIQLSGEVASIQPAVHGIMTVVSAQACAVGREFEVEVALLEALANAVEHGCGSDPNKIIEVCVACEEGRGMLIVVRDPGTGFDPAEIPCPVTGDNLFFDRGRGIFLINRLMDEVEYRGGGTEIWMRKR